MRIPKSEFTDADLKLCRAHSEAVANEPDYVLWARHFDTQEERDALSNRVSVVLFETEVCMPADLPLPPSYWDDLEHWLKTLAPAKPAAEQPEPAADVWHSEAPSVAGVYVTRWAGFEATNRHWDGSRWSEGYYGASSDTERQDDSDIEEGPVEWLRLIEADKPAQQPAQNASTHSVCIAENACFKIGSVITGSQDPEYWLPCDASGWVTHVPTADSLCPVPDGVDFEFKVRDGELSYPGSKNGINAVNWDSGRSFICAWRPIAPS